MAPLQGDGRTGASRERGAGRGVRVEILPVENVDIGGAIQHLRGFRAQAELAKAAKLDPSTWSLYESGQRRPSGEKLDLVLKAVGCSRLDFEEVVWSFRRRRLRAAQQQAGRVGEARPAAQRISPSARSSEGNPRLSADLEDLRARAASFLDDLLALILEARPGSGWRTFR